MQTMITGHEGFVGRHMQKLLDAVPFVEAEGNAVDLCNQESIRRAIRDKKPGAIIHLAAQSNVPEAFNDPLKTYQVNFLGTLNLLTVLKEQHFRGRFLYVGSGDVYGLATPEALPFVEDFCLHPRNPYAVSKVAAEALCYQWSQTEDFEIILARPFNHIGPGQSDQFAIASFAKQIVEIKRGKQNPIVKVGDLDVTRDFTDVRDIARAYQLLLEKGNNGEIYNVCSGIERSIRSVLLELFYCADVTASIEQTKMNMRKVEQKRVFGSCKKLHLHTGWEPQIPLKQTLLDILADWETKRSCEKKR
jgi:GDP-4-dehydro-6-deoxy-D-mannose reductase